MSERQKKLKRHKKNKTQISQKKVVEGQKNN